MDIESRAMPFYELAKELGVSHDLLLRQSSRGRLGVSGHRIKLERWLTEVGWVTSREAVERFRRRLNDPLYVGEYPVADTGT